jgi:hypothetical protein
MSVDRNGVRFMIADDLIYIGKWLPGQATCLGE